MEPYYTINGVDMVPYLSEKGLEWSEEDIDGDDSGRTMDGIMHRALIARKDKHTLNFRELTLQETRQVLNAFNTQYLTVETNFHPKKTGVVIMQMYNSSRASAVASLYEDNDSTWEIKPISVIER